MRHGPDLIFVNGSVFISNRRLHTAQCVAVAGQRIVYVGDNAGALAKKGRHTEVIDLGGRTLMPGFIDAHAHIATHGTNLFGLSCKYPEVKSVRDIQRRVHEKARSLPPGAWIRGWGYNQHKLAEGRHPTRWDLDEVAPEHPVILVRTDYHNAVVNTAAMRVLGIAEDAPDPEGGRIVRDEQGRITGLLQEQAYMVHADTAGYSDAELEEAVGAAAQDYLSYGVTSLHDMGGAGARNLRAMQAAVASGRCKVRLYAMLWSFYQDRELHEAFFGTGLNTGMGDDRFKIGHFKIMLDGSSSGPTARTRQPYTHDPSDSGILHMPPEEAVERIVEAHRRGFPCTAHAVGDAAIDILLTAYEEAQRRYPRPGIRHRIEHCVMAAPDLRARIKKLGVIPSPQPAWFYEFGDGYLKNYGPERVSYFKPLRTWLDEGVLPALGTDCPVTFPDPILCVWEAASRVSAGGQVLNPAERIGVAEALYCYTMGGAHAAYEENVKGSIEVGKLADLCVLSGDILTTPLEDLRSLRCDMTVVGGEVVFSR